MLQMLNIYSPQTFLWQWDSKGFRLCKCFSPLEDRATGTHSRTC